MRLDDIEKDYRLGTFTNVDIGKRNGVSEAYIRKVAKNYGWVKGESRDIRSTLPEVYKQHMKKPLSESINAKNTDKLAFMLMDLAERMLEELHQVTTSPGEFEQMIIDETSEDKEAKRRNAMLKAVSLPIRANTLKTISQILIHAKGIVSSDVSSNKKEQNAERAKEATKGRFAPSEPPRLATIKL
jgi:hypothetical protein